MLTADLVDAARRAGELRLRPLDDAARSRALELARTYVDIAHTSVGITRDEFDAAMDAVSVAPRDRRLAAGLRKLVEDRCVFDADAAVAPDDLRRDTFTRAAEARRALAEGQRFDRDAVLAAVAAARGVAAAAVEAGLYADLRGAHKLISVEPVSASGLASGYDLAQAQAVLLRAVRVTVDVDGATPGAYRALFRRLKFLRLVPAIAAQKKGGYRIEIDGPYSLFESVTRYGLALALALPAVAACGTWKLEAEVRWGKDRQSLRFRLGGDAREPGADDPPARLPDDVAALVESVRALAGPWKVETARSILDLPGVGVCVPDLVFTHAPTGRRAYLEVLGWWSRDAVWRRVELVEAGMREPILFAVGEHLRVSEAALAPEQPAALYVYKRTMSARAIIERLERLLGA